MNFLKNSGIFCKKPQIKYTWAKSNRGQLGIKKPYEILNISRSGYYWQLKRSAKTKTDELGSITMGIFHKLSGIYRVKAALKPQGIRGPILTIQKKFPKYSFISRSSKHQKSILILLKAYPIPVLRLTYCLEIFMPAPLILHGQRFYLH